jgi:hypothetical protein
VRQRQQVTERVGQGSSHRTEIRSVGDDADARVPAELGSDLGRHHSIDRENANAVAGLVGRREKLVARFVDRVDDAARRHRRGDPLAPAERELDVGLGFQEVAGVAQRGDGALGRPALWKLTIDLSERDDRDVRGDEDRHGG